MPRKLYRTVGRRDKSGFQTFSSLYTHAISLASYAFPVFDFSGLRNLLFCLYPVYWILRTQLACELLRDVVDLQVLRYLCANAVAARYIIYRIYFAFCIPMSFGGVSDAAWRQFPLPFTAWEVNFHLQSELGSWLGTTTVTFGSQVWLLKHLTLIEWCHFV